MDTTRTRTMKVPVTVPSGQQCAACVGRLREAVAGLPGVESVEVDPRTSTLTVLHDASVLSEEAVEAEARRLGLDLGETVAHAAYRLTGLD